MRTAILCVPSLPMPVAVGSSHEVTLVVGLQDTAPALRAGDLEVLSTSRLIALCEEAACAAVADRLRPDQTTMGWRVQLDHMSAARVGSAVRACATLDRIEGRRIGFIVSVYDSGGLLAAGRICRLVVDRQAFLDESR